MFYPFNNRIVAIQFLHESDTVQEIQNNKIKIEEHRNTDLKTELSVKQEHMDGMKINYLFY